MLQTRAMSDTKRTTLGPADFREGEFRGYAVGRRNVLVTCVDGQVRAMDDWCNHAGCLLSGGWLHQQTIVCPCHEVGFDLATGKNVTSPGIAGDQRVYPIEIVDGQVVVLDFPTE
jgi:3-phenylpropionate/trans-cinnamate dioxygenase ferredoxin subunit